MLTTKRIAHPLCRQRNRCHSNSTHRASLSDNLSSNPSHRRLAVRISSLRRCVPGSMLCLKSQSGRCARLFQNLSATSSCACHRTNCKQNYTRRLTRTNRFSTHWVSLSILQSVVALSRRSSRRSNHHLEYCREIQSKWAQISAYYLLTKFISLLSFLFSITAASVIDDSELSELLRANDPAPGGKPQPA